MQREDYLLRMIAQMGRVLARIRRMLLEGKNSEAGDELEHAAGVAELAPFGLRPSDFFRLSAFGIRISSLQTSGFP